MRIFFESYQESKVFIIIENIIQRLYPVTLQFLQIFFQRECFHLFFLYYSG